MTFELVPGEALTVVADGVSAGTIFRLSNAAGNGSQGATPIGAGQTKVFGPYSTPARFSAQPSAGSLTVTQGPAAILPGLRVAHAKYDFSVDGGVQGTIAPANSDTIPDNAILVGGTINSPTAVTSLGSATVAIGTSAGSSTTSIKGATGKASYSIDAIQNAVPVFATPVKMTAAGSITFTIGTADLTAGVIEAWVFYVLADT
jgi:hypothetical protein